MCLRLATVSSLSSLFLFTWSRLRKEVSVWQRSNHSPTNEILSWEKLWASSHPKTFFFFTHPSVGHQYILSLLGSIVPNCEQCWEYTQPQSTLRNHLALPAGQNTSQQVKLLSQKKFTHHGSDSCQEGSHENCLAQTLRLDNPFCRRPVRSDDIFGGPVNSITGSLIITDKRGSRSAKIDHLRFSTERATRVLHLLVLACECQWERHSRTNSWYSRPLRELTKHH